MGCRIIRLPRSSKLALRLQWVVDGHSLRSQESLGISDTAKNRAVVQRDIAGPIAAEMRARRFDQARYLEWFPYGSKAQEFRRALGHRPGTPAVEPSEVLTVRGYYERWIARQVPPHVRPAQARDYRNQMTRYILPEMGDHKLDEVRPAHLFDLRARLSQQKSIRGGELSPKTVRNVIDATFRAMFRDARAEELVTGDPFSALRWQRVRTDKPDPFEPDERDAIIEWFRNMSGGHYHAFIATLFKTGMRPSEAVALRVGDLDCRQGSLSVCKSRYLGTESATKTGASERMIPLEPSLLKILKAVVAGRHASEYLFVNMKGGPVDQAEWPKDHWAKCLKALGIRERKFYATRHTFISLVLDAGSNPFAVAEYVGTSVAMIERNYGKSDLRRVLDHIDGQGAKTQPRRRAVAFRAKKPARMGTSPTGFEPVLPT